MINFLDRRSHWHWVPYRYSTARRWVIRCVSYFVAFLLYPTFYVQSAFQLQLLRHPEVSRWCSHKVGTLFYILRLFLGVCDVSSLAQRLD